MLEVFVAGFKPCSLRSLHFKLYLNHMFKRFMIFTVVPELFPLRKLKSVNVKNLCLLKSNDRKSVIQFQ